MTDDRLAQARAEAERRWPKGEDDTLADRVQIANLRDTFMDGVEWADANPAPRTITPDYREELMYKLVGIEMMSMGPDADMILDFLGIEVEEE